MPGAPPLPSAPGFPAGMLTTPTLEQLTSPNPKKKGAGTLIVVVVLLVLSGIAALYFLKPQLFGTRTPDNGPTATVSAASPLAPFDTEEAGRVLYHAAMNINHCSEPGGPTGAGRVNVLYTNSGEASSAQVSAPFKDTSVGQCLIASFRGTKVAPFSGQPVVVAKTFTIH